jgi:hypothetical protein
MDVLTQAAAAVAEKPPAAESGTKKPSGRRSKLEVAQGKATDCEAKLNALDLSLIELRKNFNGKRLGPGKSAIEAKVKETEGKLAALRIEYNGLTAAVMTIQQSIDSKTAAAEKKAAEAAAKLDASKPMTEEAMKILVTARLGLQHRFDNKVDKNENLWEVGVLAEYQKRIDDGTLPSSDKRSAESLKAKYSTLAGKFRLYAAKVARMKASGAPGDEIENMTEFKDCVTSIFWEHEVQERAATVPPFHINGGNAAAGGEANPFQAKRGRVVAGGGSDDSDNDSDADGGAAREAASDGEGAGEGDVDFDEDELGGGLYRARGSGSGGFGAAPASGSASGSAPKPKKAMHMGGSSKEKYRPAPKKAKKQDALMAFLERMEEKAAAEKHERETARQKELTEARAHELKVLALLMGHAPSAPARAE